MGPGKGGKAAHFPPSNVASQLRKKNAKPAVLADETTAAFPSFSAISSMAILSPNLLNDSRVGISSDRCVRRMGAKESMISQRRLPEKVAGLLLVSRRYVLYSSRPGENSSRAQCSGIDWLGGLGGFNSPCWCTLTSIIPTTPEAFSIAGNMVVSSP